jgi:hypothetical protein
VNPSSSDPAGVQYLVDEDMPALFSGADTTSLAGQRHFLLTTRIRLGALLIAAALGLVVGEVGPPDWFALIAVAAFVAAIVSELYLLYAKPERAWYEGRAAAESVKTLAWRYAVGGEPFSLAIEDVDDRFLGRLKEILTDLSDLELQAGPRSGEQITPTMRRLREKTRDQRRLAYRVARIEDQRDWYQRKAHWNEDRARQLRITAIVVEGLAVIVGVLTVAGLIRLDLLGLSAAAVATVVAWLQTKQHETLARAYSVASQELAAVRSDWETDRTEEEWATFVNEAEEAISREHTLWRASRGVQARWERSRP